MHSRHRATLEAIFDDPVRLNLKWRDVDALLLALGARREEREGSRVAFELRGRIHSIHKPHPGNELKRYQVKDLREFLTRVGVTP